jgi:predicted dehydrogenase
MPDAPLRIGILGAATIAPMALIEPAKEHEDVVVAAVAARDVGRAKAFAEKHGIGVVHDSYEALIADPEIDAIYNPLPNGLHGRWTIAALKAGKHVLCEKPFTANAEEAEAVAAVARETGLVCMEAFHYRYHALIRRMLEIIASGELGAVRHVEAWFAIPLFRKDIRWQLELAGGTAMDVGCYTIHIVRTLAGAEPRVRSAKAKLKSPGIDRWMRADMDFADGRTGRITASMASLYLLGVGARVIGSKGRMQAFNPIMPQYFHSLKIRSAQGRRKEHVAKEPGSYSAQLRAFADAVLKGAPIRTGPEDSIANMRVIDACYEAAGMKRREPTAV